MTRARKETFERFCPRCGLHTDAYRCPEGCGGTIVYVEKPLHHYWYVRIRPKGKVGVDARYMVDRNPSNIVQQLKCIKNKRSLDIVWFSVFTDNLAEHDGFLQRVDKYTKTLNSYLRD